MKRANTTISWISIALIALFAYWSISAQRPSVNFLDSDNPNEFSVDSVMSHLKVIAKDIHYIGTPYHKEVQTYLKEELDALGLQAHIQQERIFRLSSDKSKGMVVENVVAKIEGSGEGKALLLMAHYDSAAPHSYGASDDGAGVATILEAVRVFLKQQEQPKNDIIVVFSDAEEASMMGARAFVEKHPFAKNVGLVLNFEARGSGGPSYMFMETDGKNGKLLQEFSKANPTHPTCNSLVYDIYKILGNQTDLTPLRKIAGIDGYNFAFIDDFYDYHTAQDTYERIDRSSLAHQGDYLTTTLNYFAYSNLDDFEAAEDRIFVNLPFIKLLHYPFSWNIPLLIVAFLFITGMVVLAVGQEKINPIKALKSLIPFLLTLVGNTLLTFGLWRLIMWIHPTYRDFIPGFPYNGYYYMGAFMALNCWLCFRIYQKWLSSNNVNELIIGPIIIWLILNLVMVVALPGGSFLIIPVFLTIAIMACSLFTEWSADRKLILFAILSLPLLYIMTPFIRIFPVALGLMAMALSSFLLALVFGLLLPVFSLAGNLKYVRYGLVGITLLLFAIATANSGFNEDKRKVNFIRYYQNADLNVSYWGSFNDKMDPFLDQFFGENPEKGILPEELILSHPFIKTFKKTESRPLASCEIILHHDSIQAGKRFIDFTLSPQRAIIMVNLLAKNDLHIAEMTVNGSPVEASDYEETDFDKKKEETILQYIFSHAEQDVRISLLMENKPLTFYMKELSYDLLSNDLFQIQPRPDYMMPQIVSDAIETIRTVEL
ncbi:MAG: M20/M25/M40 family metallo-hydrolase [Bacteroidota bacterium]